MHIMRHFTWSQENEVFLPQIDAEHRDLFRVAEGLQQAIDGKAVAADVNVHLHGLIAHAEEHFSHEESLMKSVKYASFGWHRQQHDTARRRLQLLAPLVETGDSGAAELLMAFLEGWLQDHTSLTDRMMAAHVRNYQRANAIMPSETPSGWLNTAETGPYSTTVQFCRTCGDQTPHEIRPGGTICLKCVEHSVRADLDRD
jgi:hemerythrin